ncbi:hypothetical protein, partial [uncultured Chryseobacterium sp.]|uniref:hypothetical protein n=1 Tax=uncultured Chryseobacterium sp. TaxID=259322 RepID=UPI0025F2A833
VFTSRSKDLLNKFNIKLIIILQSYDSNATKRDVLFFNRKIIKKMQRKRSKIFFHMELFVLFEYKNNKNVVSRKKK